MNLPLAPLLATGIGIAAAAGIAVMPAPMLEGLVTDSGIGALISAAAPPLGLTARLAVAAGVGALTAVFAWFALFLLIGTRIVTLGKRDREAAESVPVVRRADAHPDAPPRPPLMATRDLGTPFLEVRARLRKGDEMEAEAETEADVLDLAPADSFSSDVDLVLDVPVPADPVIADAAASHAQPTHQPRPAPAEAALPDDLDRPLSAYDSSAIPDEPLPAPRRLTPLRRKPDTLVYDETERFETFELTPTVRDAPVPPRFPVPAPAANAEQPIAHPETEATIHALLDRLERGVVRRGLAAPRASAPAAPQDSYHGLEEALVTLRNLARRA